jgi:hypothetical protein
MLYETPMMTNNKRIETYRVNLNLRLIKNTLLQKNNFGLPHEKYGRPVYIINYSACSNSKTAPLPIFATIKL